MEDLFGEGEGFGDILGSIFGRGRRGAARSLDLEGTVPITLEEAYRGTTRMVDLPDGRRIEVKVPAGVGDGTILKVPGLRARVEIAPDPTFERDGRDLRTLVAVPLAAALLGGEVEVPTLRGSRVNLAVPAGTQNGTRLRLRGLGMPDPRGGKPGDLYAEVKVRLPVPMDERTRAWAEEMPR
jgi:DnaJ-class molecular chaperone